MSGKLTESNMELVRMISVGLWTRCSRLLRKVRQHCGALVGFWYLDVGEWDDLDLLRNIICTMSK